jgi:hypothetical protein
LILDSAKKRGEEGVEKGTREVNGEETEVW